jgi:hypothetical protein
MDHEALPPARSAAECSGSLRPAGKSGAALDEFMFRMFTLLATTLVLGATLTGCGLAETGAASAAAGASQVQQAQEAKRTEERVKQQVDAAMQVDAARRSSADKESQ